jgi:predicted DNA-binding protein
MSTPQKRPGRGRPRIPRELRATERISLAITCEMRDRIDALARAQGTTISEIVRHGLDLAIKDLDPDDD